jgi:mannose-6-phosphate isomerase-like protein (cupin superfamily)
MPNIVDYELIPNHLVERGEIKKFPIYKNAESKEITEIALLELSPGAKIKLHRHNSDSEIYFILGSKRYECCHIGGEHSLENTTGEVMQVLSVKSATSLEANEILKKFSHLISFEE